MSVKWSTRVLGDVLGILTIGAAVGLVYLRRAPVPSTRVPAVAAPAAAPEPAMVTESVPIERGDTLDDLLGRSGIELAARAEIISAVRRVFDVKQLRAGAQLTLTRQSSGALESLEYAIDPDRSLRLSRSAAAFEAAIVEIPGAVRELGVCGTMQGSLFESIERAGERPELALAVADIFAWDLDFYTDPQPGDEFCLALEKKQYTNGQAASYRSVLAARYHSGGSVHEGYLFRDGSGRAQYYAADGHSLQAAFLRSPMKFEARVSSRFSHRRMHPVLKIYRPHLGTDYAAPVGTPVQAVAAGKVTFSGRSGGAGRMVRIRHANGYESAYLHLSRTYVKAGQTVRQGQRIAAVGASGVVTGPHLDFRLRRNGSYVDFERLKPPRATRLSGEQMPAFAAVRDRFAALMDGGVRAEAAGGGASAN